MDFNFMEKKVIGFFMEFYNYMIIFVDYEIWCCINFKVWRGLFVGFEFKYGYSFGYIIIIIFYWCDIFKWIV